MHPATHPTNHIPLHLLIFTSLHHRSLMYLHKDITLLCSTRIFSLIPSEQAEIEMAKKNKQSSLLILSVVAGLLSQSLVIPVISTASLEEDQKTYYHPPNPHAGTSPPSGSHHTPSHGSGGSHGSTPPSHGTPSHGRGGGHRSSPPSNCGTPPSGGHHDPTPPTTGSSPPIVTPRTPSTPTYGSPPTPSTPTYGIPPTVISPPTSPSINPGTPSTPTYGSPPTTPSIDPGTPSTPTYSSPPTTPSIDPGTPSTPTYGSPPTTPSIDPGTPAIPGISIPSPPFSFDPNSPPFSFDPNSPPFPCNYWRTHPALIWGLFGFWGATLGGAFGLSSSGTPEIGSHLSLEQALSNTRTDGYGSLYREGTASLLNSMVSKSFPFTTEQVRDNFISSLGSNKAAAAQARVFKLANEARLKPRT